MIHFRHLSLVIRQMNLGLCLDRDLRKKRF